jgi:hypothetical protein
MIYLHTNDSLAVTVKPNTKGNISRRPCYYYTFYKNNTLIEIVYVSKIYYYTPFQYPNLMDTSVALTSQVRTSLMLLLQIV